jgi:hypothetical protein
MIILAFLMLILSIAALGIGIDAYLNDELPF